MSNLDKEVLDEYNEWNGNATKIKMFEKHVTSLIKNGFLVKNQKEKTKVNFDRNELVKGVIDLKSILETGKFTSKKISQICDSKLMDLFYVISQSITQSYRTSAGKKLEDIFYSVLDKNNISYTKQVFVDNEGNFGKREKSKRMHVLDALIPKPKCKNIKDYKGKIISLKTTLRERYLQDVYVGKIYIITLENARKIENCEIIKIDDKEKNLTKFIKSLTKS